MPLVRNKPGGSADGDVSVLEPELCTRGAALTLRDRPVSCVDSVRDHSDPSRSTETQVFDEAPNVLGDGDRQRRGAAGDPGCRSVWLPGEVAVGGMDRRDPRDPCDAGGELPVQVSVDQVRVNEI